MKTLEILSGNPSENELVALVMAVQALPHPGEEEEQPNASSWALSGPFNTQRRAVLTAPGSPWQRSGHLGDLW